MTAICCRCQKPLACTLSPGELGLHAACSHAAIDEAWRALDARKKPLADVGLREATYRVVGVNRGGKRETVATALSLDAAARWERCCGQHLHANFVRYLVEPEE